MSKLEIAGDRVLVRWGPVFTLDIDRSNITGVRVMRPSTWAGIGVHWWKGAWVVNGRFGEAVELTLNEPVKGRLLGVPVPVRRIQVVVPDPKATERELLPA